MLIPYIPKLEELSFRESLLKDPLTMAYNNAYGGTINFDKSNWDIWYKKWILSKDNKYFYRYLKEENSGEFIGEIAYHYDESRDIFLISIIIFSSFRGRGFGKEGLAILIREAYKNHIKSLYDEVAIDNIVAINLLRKCGFEEIYSNKKIVVLKKDIYLK